MSPVLHTLTKDGKGRLSCEACEESFNFDWPISVRMLAAVAKGFAADHRGCQFGSTEAVNRALLAEQRLRETADDLEELKEKTLKIEKSTCTCREPGAFVHDEGCAWVTLLRKAEVL